MSGPVKSQKAKRTYDGARRREQAEETRLRVLDAARELFVDEGYGRTTIAAVASRAAVSVETVYAAFRNKPALLHHVWYSTFRGDDEDVRLLHRPEIQAVLAEPDLPTRLRLHARTMTPVLRRFTPLLRAATAAATHEKAAATLITEYDAGRLDACTHYAEAAATTGRLSVSQDECRDILWASLDGALWQSLVAERGWSDERFADWLGSWWVAQLVRPPTD
jgi:AcrR family transcriptional regulator